MPPAERPVLLIDVANVLGSRADGWWRDRAGATRRLLAELEALRAERRVVCVLEGAARAAAPAGLLGGQPEGLEVVHARSSGDDAIAALADPTTLVVTADRGLRDRVAACGAEVVGPRWLLEQLPAPVPRARPRPSLGRTSPAAAPVPDPRSDGRRGRSA